MQSLSGPSAQPSNPEELHRALDRERRWRTMLQKITQKLLSTMNQSDMIDEVFLYLSQLYPVLDTDLGLVDPSGEYLVVYKDHDRVPVTGSLAGKVYLSGETMIIQDVRNNPNAYAPTLEKFDIYSSINVPIIGRHEKYGVLSVNSIGQPYHFDEVDIELMESVANSIGLCMDNARLYTMERMRSDTLTTLFDITGYLNEPHPIDELMFKVVSSAQRLFYSDTSELFVVKGDVLECIASTTPAYVGLQLPMKESLAGYVYSSGLTSSTPNMFEDSRAIEVNNDIPIQSSIISPVIHNSETLGVLSVGHRGPFAFEMFDKRILEFLAQKAGAAIRNSHVFLELAQKLNTCTVTGVYNRRYLEQYISDMKALGVDRPITVMMIDIDHFKVVNDTFGHAVGDRVLRDVATLISQIIGPNDILARYGGEEFTLIVPELQFEKVYELAEKIRELVMDSTQPKVTLSIGITQGTTQSFPIDKADIALYKAKENGRNCVVVNM